MCDVRLATSISSTVDRRLRMLVLIKGQTLSRVLSDVLDEALPQADALAAKLATDEAPQDETAAQTALA